MEKKYLRWIGIAAVVLTCIMVIYTVAATLSAGNSQAGNTPVQPPEQATAQTLPQAPQVDEKLFPAQLAGMTRGEVVTGQKAIDSVSQLHGTSIQAANAYVVNYIGTGQEQMIIWVSEAKNAQDAQALFTEMNSKMPTTKYFQNYKSVKINGHDYKSVTSQDGMQHYYWLNGIRNIWIAIMAKDPAAVLQQVAPLY